MKRDFIIVHCEDDNKSIIIFVNNIEGFRDNCVYTPFTGFMCKESAVEISNLLHSKGVI